MYKTNLSIRYIFVALLLLMYSSISNAITGWKDIQFGDSQENAELYLKLKEIDYKILQNGNKISLSFVTILAGYRSKCKLIFFKDKFYQIKYIDLGISGNISNDLFIRIEKKYGKPLYNDIISGKQTNAWITRNNTLWIEMQRVYSSFYYEINYYHLSTCEKINVIPELYNKTKDINREKTLTIPESEL